MMKSLATLILAVFLVGTSGSPHIRVARQAEGASEDNTEQPSEIETKLGLPSNSTSIRANIVDTFSCEDRTYGYYADVENDCQVFHVCLPVTFPDGKAETYKWSFICPGETIFSQDSFTCARPQDAVPCEEAPNLYSLNANFGVTDVPAPAVSGDAPSDGVRQRSAALKTPPTGDADAAVAKPEKKEEEEEEKL